MRIVSAILFLSSLAIAATPATKPAGVSVILSASSAPCTVHVQALNIPLASGTPLTAGYHWDFGDPSAPHNTLDGFNAAHTFDHEGKYTITLHLEEAGQVQLFKVVVQVLPNQRRPIYVSATGDDTNHGQSADHAIRSASRLRKLLTNDTRVLFHRGDTFPLPDAILLTQAGIQLTSYGQGANPIIQWTGPCNSGVSMITCTPAARDILIENLTFDTANSANDHVATAISAAGTNVAIRNCTFLNVDNAVNANGKPRGLLIQNCSSPLDAGLREYFLWLEGSDAVVLDNTVANSVFQHDIRASSYTRALIAYNHLTNLDRHNIEPADISKATINMQKGSYVYVANNTIAKGGLGVGPLGNDDGLRDPTARTTWAVIENNIVDDTMIELHHGLEHVSVRNNHIHQDDGVAINIEGHDDRYERTLVDASIVNNIATNNAETGFFMRVWGKADGITLRGNRYDAPKLILGKNESAAVWTQTGDMSSFRLIQGNTFPSKN